MEEDRAVAFAGRAQVTAVSARNRRRQHGPSIDPLKWFDDPCELAGSPEIDVFVELMGGADGPAKRAVEIALSHGKPVVTANKALLAEHGRALAKLAEDNGASLRFEAAVAGGVPIIKVMREALRVDEINSVAGILNGTCNYILTEMERKGLSFADALADAQALGYAEADPTFDVGGIDAGHKIAILAALAFRAAPDFNALRIEGIERIEAVDIQYARELGYRIKLIASARVATGGVIQRCNPVLLPLEHPLAKIDGALNAIVIDSATRGRLTFAGAGAGGAPTAAAVAADLIDLLAEAKRSVFGQNIAALANLSQGEAPDSTGQFYMRLRLRDRPGAIASVSETLARHNVSIDSFLQKTVTDAAGVPIVVTTHDVSENVLRRCVTELAALDTVVGAPCVMPMEPAASAA
ncbi:MAG: homoserine dehydrogenase [Caulobacterales bacterium]